MLDPLSVKYFKLATNRSEYKETSNSIACRCPICGDSKTRKNVKRLTLFSVDGSNIDFVNCFNAGCPCENKTIYTFLRDFYPDLLPLYKKEKFKSKITSLKDIKTNNILNTKIDLNVSNDSNNSSNLNSNFFDNLNISNDFNSSNNLNSNDFKGSNFFDDLNISNDLNNFNNFDNSNNFNSSNNFKSSNDSNGSNDFNSSSNPNIDNLKSNNSTNFKENIILYDLKPYFKPLTDEAKNYLLSRGIQPNDKWYVAKSNLKINEILYKIKNYLIIPLYKNDLMYGFYSRSLKEKRFITFVSTPGYKVWNWFNIDKTKPVYIFESIFDALSSGLDNVIANLGAKLPEERIKELNEPVFCLDNDKTGAKVSIKYAKMGYKVFIMPNKYTEKDLNELKLNHPELDIPNLIKSNIYKGISALTRLKLKL